MSSLLAPAMHVGTGKAIKGSPGMASLNGKLYICWSRTDNRINIGYATTGADFITVSTLSNTSAYGCSLAGFNNPLYPVYTDTNNNNLISVQYSTIQPSLSPLSSGSKRKSQKPERSRYWRKRFACG